MRPPFSPPTPFRLAGLFAATEIREAFRVPPVVAAEVVRAVLPTVDFAGAMEPALAGLRFRAPFPAFAAAGSPLVGRHAELADAMARALDTFHAQFPDTAPSTDTEDRSPCR